MTYPVVPDGLVVASARLANDQHGNLLVLLMGRGPFPMLAWTVPRQFVDELLVDGSAALVQCDAETGGVGLHFPPNTGAARLAGYFELPDGRIPAPEEPRDPAPAG
jgi:hypothetical protein